MAVSWKRNFYTLWIAEVVAIVGFQAVQPFLPYYIQEFEVADLNEALLWTGYMGTAAGLAMALSSPVWGSLADRFGRKPMVVRSMLGGGAAVLFMAWAASVGQLLLARTLQGALSGTVVACITLVSTTTPRQHLGFALGMMQGAFMLGVAFGPMLGGLIIDHFGYRDCFLASGAVVVLAGVGVQLWVREAFCRRAAEGEEEPGFVEDARRLLHLPFFLLLLLSMTLIQFSFGFIMPVLPLFLQQLARSDDVVSLAGFIFSAAGLVGAVAAAVMGKWSETIGARRALVGGLVGTAVFFLAEGFAARVEVLAALMVLSALPMGVIRPVANNLVAGIVPEADRGKAFGVLSSATALGWSLGPGIGGYVGAGWGFRSAFFVVALLFVLVAAWVWRVLAEVRVQREEKSLNELKKKDLALARRSR